ncbi:MAG: hypothetical protein EA380_03310 [Phycisphaeraceae bacterium]|nr:MAG: hypothetical protein EA380_03310 [Phycisphaeraceae bacterium]
MSDAEMTSSNAEGVPSEEPNGSEENGSGGRTVDLGREDQLVPWRDWFVRAVEMMLPIVPEDKRDNIAFRVTLKDKRFLVIRGVSTHVSRGRCFVGENRWGERDQICDVITGYVLLGHGADGTPVVACVPPAMIVSVECVIGEVPGEREPFGFESYLWRQGRPRLEEVEESLFKQHSTDTHT